MNVLVNAIGRSSAQPVGEVPLLVLQSVPLEVVF